MLALTRRDGEEIVIIDTETGEEITIIMVESRAGQARIGIKGVGKVQDPAAGSAAARRSRDRLTPPPPSRASPGFFMAGYTEATSRSGMKKATGESGLSSCLYGAGDRI